MQHWVEIISTIVGAGGIFGFVSYFLFFRESKRLKGAEATAKELANMTVSIEALEKQVEYLWETIKKLQEQLNERNQLVQQLYRERDILEKKYAQKKSSINEALACPGNKDKTCPVLVKLKELENEYLKSQINDEKT
jgi:peptidoglycan hydrolase CwlO-like protein